MINRRTFLSAVGATAATAAVPRFANAQGTHKLVLYANVGPVLTHYDSMWRTRH